MKSVQEFFEELIQDTEAKKLIAVQRMDHFKERLAEASIWWAKNVLVQSPNKFVGSELKIYGASYICTDMKAYRWPEMRIEFTFITSAQGREPYLTKVFSSTDNIS